MHPVLHVLVVGFHHKRGSQVEYCYPPLSGDSVETDPDRDVPPEWASLPALAMPDGAHNLEQDVTYFLLPSLENHNRSVFGISCCRQMAADDLKRKGEDVTRTTVQKSVVVLSTVPLFGVLKYKLELITHAYFNERDFSKVEVLRQMYTNLCDLFDENYLDSQTFYAHISLEPLLQAFKYRTLELFKLVLLERRVIFDVFPASVLGEHMVGLITLFPGLLEEGLFEASSYSVQKRRTPKSRAAETEGRSEEEADSDEIHVVDTSDVDLTFTNDLEVAQEAALTNGTQANNPSSLKTNEYGFPLSIFTKGCLFHPYCSISDMDTISSDAIRAFCIGVTNAIFRQRRDLADVTVTVTKQGDGQIDVLSADVRKEIALTSADRRFMEYILRTTETRSDPAVWEGSDDWIRAQFQTYLLSLFVTVQANVEKSVTDFGADFVTAWKRTHSYRVWSAASNLSMTDIEASHPFAGQTSVNDILARMSRSLNTSEQGRKMLSTFANTGRYVSVTGNKFRATFAGWARGAADNSNSAGADASQ